MPVHRLGCIGSLNRVAYRLRPAASAIVRLRLSSARASSSTARTQTAPGSHQKFQPLFLPHLLEKRRVQADLPAPKTPHGQIPRRGDCHQAPQRRTVRRAACKSSRIIGLAYLGVKFPQLPRFQTRNTLARRTLSESGGVPFPDCARWDMRVRWSAGIQTPQRAGAATCPLLTITRKKSNTMDRCWGGASRTPCRNARSRDKRDGARRPARSLLPQPARRH